MDEAWLDGDKSWLNPQINRLRGEVFLDGTPLDEVETLAEVQSTPSSWAASTDGLTVYANFAGANPNNALAEIVMREQITAPPSGTSATFTSEGSSSSTPQTTSATDPGEPPAQSAPPAGMTGSSRATVSRTPNHSAWMLDS